MLDCCTNEVVLGVGRMIVDMFRNKSITLIINKFSIKTKILEVSDPRAH